MNYVVLVVVVAHKVKKKKKYKSYIYIIIYIYFNYLVMVYIHSSMHVIWFDCDLMKHMLVVTLYIFDHPQHKKYTFLRFETVTWLEFILKTTWLYWNQAVGLYRHRGHKVLCVSKSWLWHCWHKAAVPRAVSTMQLVLPPVHTCFTFCKEPRMKCTQSVIELEHFLKVSFYYWKVVALSLTVISWGLFLRQILINTLLYWLLPKCGKPWQILR